MLDWTPYKELIEVLSNDLIASGAELTKPNTQFRRRTLVRSFFAQVEGEAFLRKRFALEQREGGDVEFSAAEFAILREEQYDLNNKGAVRTQQKFLKLADNLRFSFRAFAKAFGSSYSLDVSGSGWQSFKNAIDIRNRITHPKRLSDLNITEDNMKDIFAAIDWYKIESLGLLRGAEART